MNPYGDSDRTVGLPGCASFVALFLPACLYWAGVLSTGWAIALLVVLGIAAIAVGVWAESEDDR